ncbi:putative gas vesicle synthesis protein, GvpG-like [Planktothrix serta PCC 8927]|uniref:Gas vesicle synthesis protein, GvpG-like n=1 Tax=Planktothrix serta PCC 8927 TaxID=671068 RepID=A0A7Z9BR38_9CYAN|nr:gas vesicle protein GvpG [Planktothrix serta]VXD16942.1 putative gas vesicle synthesis protein, GvpG-like [Planktothrix serta PCC 8927]
MILRLLLSPITAPFEGVIWIGEQLVERAEAELDDKENLSKRLLALQLAFDMGDISEEDFEVQEEELLLQIQTLEDENTDEMD